MSSSFRGPCYCFCNRPFIDWRIQMEDSEYRESAKCHLSNNREDETHGYRRENIPAGYNFIGASASPLFNPDDSIENSKKDSRINWRINYNDPNFVHKALNIPPGICLREDECHEYSNIGGEDQIPSPILPAAPPYIPTCLKYPCLAHKDHIKFPNNLGEKEWRTASQAHQMSSTGFVTTNEEVSQYDRKVKTCDPYQLPQVNENRMFELPSSQIKTKKYLRNRPMTFNNLPNGFVSEDKGESTKRETRGPDQYNGPGYSVESPLYHPESIPCGFKYKEQKSQCHSKKNLPAGCCSSNESCPPDIPHTFRCYPSCPCPIPKSPVCIDLSANSCCDLNVKECTSENNFYPNSVHYISNYEPKKYSFPSYLPPLPKLPPQVTPCPYPSSPPRTNENIPLPSLPPLMGSCPPPKRPPCPRISSTKSSESYHSRSIGSPIPDLPPKPKIINEPSPLPSSLYSNYFSSFSPSDGSNKHWYYLPNYNQPYLYQIHQHQPTNIRIM